MVVDVNVGEVSSKGGFQDLHKGDGNGDANAHLDSNGSHVASNGLQNGNGSLVQNVGDGPVQSEESKHPPGEQGEEEGHKENGSSTEKHEEVVLEQESAEPEVPAVQDAQPQVQQQSEIVADPKLDQESQFDESIDIADQPADQSPRTTDGDGDAADAVPTAPVEESHLTASECVESDESLSVKIDSQIQSDSHKDVSEEVVGHVATNPQCLIPSNGNGESPVLSPELVENPSVDNGEPKAENETSDAEKDSYCAAGDENSNKQVQSESSQIDSLGNFDENGVGSPASLEVSESSGSNQNTAITVNTEPCRTASVEDGENMPTVSNNDARSEIVTEDNDAVSSSNALDGDVILSEELNKATVSIESQPLHVSEIAVEHSVSDCVEEGRTQMESCRGDNMRSDSTAEEISENRSMLGKETVISSSEDPNLSENDSEKSRCQESENIDKSCKDEVLISSCEDSAVGRESSDVVVSGDLNVITVSTENQSVHICETAVEHGARDSVEGEGKTQMENLPHDNTTSESMADDTLESRGVLENEAAISTSEVLNLSEDNSDKSKCQQPEDVDQSHEDLISSCNDSAVDALGRQNGDVIVSEDSDVAAMSDGNHPVHNSEIAVEHSVRDSVKDEEGTRTPSLPSDNMNSESTTEDISESMDMVGKEATISTHEVPNLGTGNDKNSKCQDSENIDQSHKVEGLISSHDDSVVDALVRQNGDVIVSEDSDVAAVSEGPDLAAASDGNQPVHISEIAVEHSARDSAKGEEGMPMPTCPSDNMISESTAEDISESRDMPGKEALISTYEVPNLCKDDGENSKYQDSENVNELHKDEAVTSSCDDSVDASGRQDGNVIVSENSDVAAVSDGNQPVHIGQTAVGHGERDSVEDEGSVTPPNCPSNYMKSGSTAEDLSENKEVLEKEGVASTSEVSNLCKDNGDKSKSQESQNIDQSCKDEGLISSHEGSIVNGLGRQNVVVRPFTFLIKHPRFEDTNLREQVENAQLQVDEKTKKREGIRAEIQKIKVISKDYIDEVDAALAKERAQRELLRSKRQEIDSVQSVINKVKNARSVEDIDVRILNMQHMIEHETLPLKEEKQFIREIRQLKQLREQLSSDAGKEDEIQKALDEKDKTEERLKALRQEADSIRDKLLKLEDAKKSLKNKYSHEFKKLGELQSDFRAADEIRQNAYMHLQDLRRQLYEKNKYFRKYKVDLKTVSDYTSTGDRVALVQFCDKQVESFMELWNGDVEFRKEYIRCNTRSTLRRLGMPDGRSIGPDDKPPVIPPPAYDKLAKAKPVLHISSTEQEKPVVPVVAEKVNDKTEVKVVEPKNQTTKSLKSKKSAPTRESAVDFNMVEIEKDIEIESKSSKEEEERARREDELRKKEEAARLKELQRLEEKAKAKEAMERKKRNAEKAKARAALRAQKEAEEREREREKRAKKKEKKKAVAADTVDGIAEGETAASAEIGNKVAPEADESKDKPNTATKRSQRPSHLIKQTKTKLIPPPLRNRSKRKMRTWMWILVAALLVLALFLVGNGSITLPFRQ